MPKHQAPRSWAKTRVTEPPARARWAPGCSCRNSETGREAALFVLRVLADVLWSCDALSSMGLLSVFG
jgi:hypothetical protein